MDVGKHTAYLLSRLLSTANRSDSRVLLGPHVGADAAVIDMGDTVLVAKSDLVTFAAERIGWYTMQVNANGIASQVIAAVTKASNGLKVASTSRLSSLPMFTRVELARFTSQSN